MIYINVILWRICLPKIRQYSIINTETFMDFVPDNTVNKLILLYVLDKMEIPLTENSILEICSSQNDWVHWMDCKELLEQLIQSKFIYKPSTDNDENRYNITVAGRECLSQFYTRIPASRRDEISKFATENKLKFKRNQEYVAKSYKNEDGSYMVDLKILEPLTTDSIFSVSIKTDTRHSATIACKRWRELAPTVYEYIYSKIIEN